MADDVNQPYWLIQKTPAACLEQNALQNVSFRVIEFFSLQYHTHIQAVFLLKALTAAMAFLYMA